MSRTKTKTTSMTAAKRSEPQASLVLTQIFNRVHRFAKDRFQRTPDLLLSVGCKDIEQYRRGSKRSFCHVFHRDGIVCTVPALMTLPINYIVGILLHEIGHTIAMREWNCSLEQEADIAVMKFLGVNLDYKGDLTLEWVSTDVVRRVLGPRPQGR